MALNLVPLVSRKENMSHSQGWPGPSGEQKRRCCSADCSAGARHNLSVKGREDRGENKEMPVTQTQIRNTRVVPRARLVGCILFGQTDLCSLREPSQREEELVPWAGGQSKSPAKALLDRLLLAAGGPTAFKSLPALTKPTSRRRCPCQINYVRPNW